MPKHRRPSRGAHARSRLPRLAAILPRTKVQQRRLALAVLCGATLAAATLGSPGSAGPGTPATTSTVASAAVAGRTGRAADRASRSADRASRRAGPSAASATAASPAATTSPFTTGSGGATAPAATLLPDIPGLTAEQVRNAAVIVSVGKQMGVSTRGQIIAVATALQESQLYNLTVAVDHDSLGLFQQRPSTGWGTPAQLVDPAYAARAFYRVLLRYTGDWDCLTCAAQRVQVSAYPDAYAKHEALATLIVNALG